MQADIRSQSQDGAGDARLLSRGVQDVMRWLTGGEEIRSRVFNKTPLDLLISCQILGCQRASTCWGEGDFGREALSGASSHGIPRRDVERRISINIETSRRGVS
jgi:hypothetical protein